MKHILPLENSSLSAPQAFYPSMVVLEARSVKELQPLIESARGVQYVEGIVVITTTAKEGDEVFHFCNEHSLHCFRSHLDPLSNLHAAGEAFDLEAMVLVKKPIPAHEIDKALFSFRRHYDELDDLQDESGAIECIRVSALKEAYLHSKDRKNVSSYFEAHPEQFRIGVIPER